MDEIKKFHEYLKNNFNDYISIIAIGSFAIKDKWIKNRSDKDFLIIFEKLPENYFTIINEFFNKNNNQYNDDYTFVPMEKNYWLKNKKHSHDFSGKFRSKTLFGKDLIPKKQIPSKEETLLIYLKGLEDVKNRIQRTLINQHFWSEKKVRNVFWKLFKHTFMYLLVKYYYDNNIYPITRSNLVNLLNNNNNKTNNILEKTLNTLNEIDNKSKEEIINIGNELYEYLNQIN